jgi:hypothetical protein
MRIVYLAGAAVPSRTANAVHVMKMCHAFKLNGHDVTLCVPNGGPLEPGVKDIFLYYGISPEFSLRRLMSPPVQGQATIASCMPHQSFNVWVHRWSTLALLILLYVCPG